MNIVGLLLAAGSATRFGSDKLAHRLPHGVPIAAQAARHLRAVVPNVFAVVKPGAGDLIPVLEREGCRVLVCEQAAEGMGASLACAVRSPSTLTRLALIHAPGTRSGAGALSSVIVGRPHPNAPMSSKL